METGVYRGIDGPGCLENCGGDRVGRWCWILHALVDVVEDFEHDGRCQSVHKLWSGTLDGSVYWSGYTRAINHCLETLCGPVRQTFLRMTGRQDEGVMVSSGMKLNRQRSEDANQSISADV